MKDTNNTDALIAELARLLAGGEGSEGANPPEQETWGWISCHEAALKALQGLPQAVKVKHE